MVSDILRLMGQPFDKKILEELIEEVDADSKYFALLLVLFVYFWLFLSHIILIHYVSIVISVFFNRPNK